MRFVSTFLIGTGLLVLGCAGPMTVREGDPLCLPLPGARREGLFAEGQRLWWVQAHAGVDGQSRWDLWTSADGAAALVAPDLGWDAKRLSDGTWGASRSTLPAGRFAFVRAVDGAARPESPPAHDVLAWAVSPGGQLWWLAAAGTDAPVMWVRREDGASVATWTAQRLWGATDEGAVVRGVSGGTWLLPKDGSAPRFLGPDAEEIVVADGKLIRIAGGSVSQMDAESGAATGTAWPGTWVQGGWVRNAEPAATSLVALADGMRWVVHGGVPASVVSLEDGTRYALVWHDTDGDGARGPSDESDVCRIMDGATYQDRSLPLRFVARAARLTSALPDGARVRFSNEAHAIRVSIDAPSPGDPDAALSAADALATSLGDVLDDPRLIVSVTWSDATAERRIDPRSGLAWVQLDGHGVSLRSGDALSLRVESRLQVDRGRGTVARLRWKGTVTHLGPEVHAVSAEVGAWSLLGEDPVTRLVSLGNLGENESRQWNATVSVDVARFPDLRVVWTVDGHAAPALDLGADREARDWWRTVREAADLGFVDDPAHDGMRLPGRVDHDLPAFRAPDGFSALPEERRAQLASSLGAAVDRHYVEAHGSGWLGGVLLDGARRIQFDRQGLSGLNPLP